MSVMVVEGRDGVDRSYTWGEIARTPWLWPYALLGAAMWMLFLPVWAALWVTHKAGLDR